VLVENGSRAITSRGRERKIRVPAPVRGHALIADADREARELSAAALRRIGFTVWEATTGSGALEVARRRRPLLALLEVRLPDMSGVELAARLREELGTRIPIVLISGDRTEPMDRVAGLLLGGDDYLVKPIDSGELRARVRALIRRAGARQRTG
jgi:two-component system OmpR family response regulator